ncbi:histidine phosphatase family protein [Propionibacterium sp.]|uniref:histidine phosphatase family protein n=1 Tax=Propionibacterium sp. TaxID=1977903 RepID=UPI0039E8C8C0
MTTPRFLLVRHGQTDWNAAGRWQGSSDIPLNSVGLAQASAAASWFARFNPVAIWSSPLERAHTTASKTAELAGCPVSTDTRLCEIDFGDFEGFTWSQLEQSDPGLWAWRTGEHDCRWSSTGETGAEVGLRVSQALQDIDASTPGGTILVFSHGTAIRCGVGTLMGWDFSTMWCLDSLGNCCTTWLNRAGESWRIERYNAEPQWNFAG